MHATRKPPPHREHPIIPVLLMQDDIDPLTRRKAALLIAGETQSGIAKRVGISRPMVYMVLAGRDRSDHVELAIAEILGVPRQLVWPEWWSEEEQLRARRICSLDIPTALARLPKEAIAVWLQEQEPPDT
jgi:transcriptional regulator with XRE-family HTH domain